MPEFSQTWEKCMLEQIQAIKVGPLRVVFFGDFNVFRVGELKR